MQYTIEETYGKLVLTQLFTHVWFGDWDHYEEAIDQLPDDLIEAFPFHRFYDREKVELWHDNYFSIPGSYFIPPYLRSEERRVGKSVDLGGRRIMKNKKYK